MLARLIRYWRRSHFDVGARRTRFLAPDVRREIEIVDNSEIHDGFVTVRMRTWNLLYVARGFGTEPPLSEPRRVAVTDLWAWHGAPWGGPVPPGDV